MLCFFIFDYFLCMFIIIVFVFGDSGSAGQMHIVMVLFLMIKLTNCQIILNKHGACI